MPGRTRSSCSFFPTPSSVAGPYTQRSGGRPLLEQPPRIPTMGILPHSADGRKRGVGGERPASSPHGKMTAALRAPSFPRRGASRRRPIPASTVEAHLVAAVLPASWRSASATSRSSRMPLQPRPEFTLRRLPRAGRSYRAARHAPCETASAQRPTEASTLRGWQIGQF